MRNPWNYHELSVTLAMLVPTAVSYLLIVIHCMLKCMLSGHKNNWQGCFGFVFLHGRRKEELIMFLIRGQDRSYSLKWHTQLVLVLISFVFFIFKGTAENSLDLKSVLTTNAVHLLESRFI